MVLSQSGAEAPLRVGVAGLGTVGAGVVDVLQRNGALIAARAGRAVKLTAVAERDQSRIAGLDLTGVAVLDDALKLAASAEIDVFVEVIGGADGIAKASVEAALKAGKDIVTANKAMLAKHGTALATLAESNGRTLSYEAAVAGGIPIIRGLREGLPANRVREVHGILNGTCNYILSTMRTTGRAFGDVLAEAQRLGYAEADPAFDIDGIDAAHKTALLAALAFGTKVDFGGVFIEGIRNVSALDVEYAEALGYRIKLLGIVRQVDNGGSFAIEQRVHPCMVPIDSAIAAVEGVFNAVIVDGDAVDKVLMTGRGAGAGPTASSVVADLVALARGQRLPTFGVPAAELAEARTVSIEDRKGAYYLRLMVMDQPGVIADVTSILRDCGVSLEAMMQRRHDPDKPVPVVLTTHATIERSMRKAVAAIGALKAVAEPPALIRIESF
jgi:homoserine dehydrogenase